MPDVAYRRFGDTLRPLLGDVCQHMQTPCSPACCFRIASAWLLIDDAVTCKGLTVGGLCALMSAYICNLSNQICSWGERGPGGIGA